MNKFTICRHCKSSMEAQQSVQLTSTNSLIGLIYALKKIFILSLKKIDLIIKIVFYNLIKI